MDLWELPVTAATALQSEGARVGIVTCEICGCALLLDERDTIDTIEAHRQWHASLEDSAVRDG